MIFIDEIDSSNCSVSPLTDRTPEMDLSFNRISGTHFTMYGIDLSECDPYACTFTLPIDTIFSKVTEISYTKTGKQKKSLKEILLVNVTQEEQWYYLKSQIIGWMFKLQSKHGISFRQYQVYPEFTKNGLIHAHGLFYSTAHGYSTGYSLMMASVWSSLNKSDLRATWSINYQGKKDYAFALCNNVSKWTEYIQKEYKGIYRCGHGQQPSVGNDIR